jgi:hypothetical protein
MQVYDYKSSYGIPLLLCIIIGYNLYFKRHREEDIMAVNLMCTSIDAEYKLMACLTAKGWSFSRTA